MEIDKIIKEQMNNVVDQEEIDSLSDYASNLSNGLSDNFSLENILTKTVNGKSIFDTSQIIDSLKELFLYEIKSAIIIGVEIVTICIVIGLLNNLSSSFGKKGISEIATLTCSIVIIGLIMNNFNLIYQLSLDTIKTISYTTELLLPVLIGILFSMGQVASGTIMSPLLLTSITIFQIIIKKVVLPGIFISTVFCLINCLTEKDYVNKLSKFLKHASLFIAGLLMSIMSGIIGIQGLIAKTSDSILIDSAKYSIDEFVPIVGGFTADTIELFIKCMGSIKNIVGIFGIIIIICIVLTPVIKILAICIIYKITALLIEPIVSKKISNGINDIGGALIALGAIMFFSSLLFIIFITCIINLGGQ